MPDFGWAVALADTALRMGYPLTTGFVIPPPNIVPSTEIRDLVILGGGPTGLFGAYYAGVREMTVTIVDSLEELGGQLIALYPEKNIYDMPGFPQVRAKDLVSDMVEQAMRYQPRTRLGAKIVGLTQRDDGVWQLSEENGGELLARTVVISAGAGGFSPRKLPLEGVDRWEGRGIHYFVKDLDYFRGKRILIVGGGDSALDWALATVPLAQSVALAHRRDEFRGHESTGNEVLASAVDVHFFHEVGQIYGDDHITGAQLFHNKSQETTELELDEILMCLGFKADLGPIKTWGLEMERGGVKVNTRMETNLPGVYAAGDVAHFDGKLKLIANGVGEVAIAVNHAKTYIDPSARAFPGHSSNMEQPSG